MAEWTYYLLPVVIQCYCIHFLVHRYRDYIAAAQERSAVCRLCSVSFSRHIASGRSY